MRSAKFPAADKLIKETTENPELADRFNRMLGETVEAMEESGLKYVFIGGIASGGLGRPRSTHDIDLFVKPEDAQLVLQALAKHGFETEKTDPSWLYKGFKEGILVDVIFKSKGDIYLDGEMYRRSITAEFHGKKLRLVAPEDLLIIKAVAHSELTPGHWHDATALLTHASLDWEYLVRRARRAPRRVLSLLLYAQSNDIWVPNFVISELYQCIFGDSHREGSSFRQQAQAARGPSLSLVSSGDYLLARFRERLAGDARTHELDIGIEEVRGKILLRGEVPVADRREAVEQLARECFPGREVENQIRVIPAGEPGAAEEIP